MDADRLERQISRGSTLQRLIQSEGWGIVMEMKDSLNAKDLSELLNTDKPVQEKNRVAIATRDRFINLILEEIKLGNRAKDQLSKI